MQIRNLNFYNPINTVKSDFLKRQSQAPTFCALKRDVFEKNETEEKQLATKHISFGGNLCIKDIDDISEDIKTDAKTSIDVGCSLKNKLDKKYGENNYVFVSIGKEPAGVAKALEVMGQDVRYMPESGISNIPIFFDINPNSVKNAFSPTYKDYLNDIGINADKIKQDKRHYIFCGYDYGTTRDFIETYIHGALELSKEDAHFEGLENILKDNTDSCTRSREKAQIKKYTDKYCNNYNTTTTYEKFGIPYVPVGTSKNIHAEIKEANTDDAVKFERALRYYYDANKDSLARLKKADSEKKFPFCVDKRHLEDIKDNPNPSCDEDYAPIKISALNNAQAGVQIGRHLKEYYDATYGKEKYVIVSIGTSPAPAAKAMEYMGTDVRYVPISGLGHVKITDKAQIDKYMTKDYKSFLDSIGITKEKIEDDDKQYIFLDYTYSGKTLENINFVLREGLGIDERKFSCDSLNDVLNKYLKTAQGMHTNYINKCINSEIGEDCGIPHIEYNRLNAINDERQRGKTRDEKALEHMICYYLNQ